MGIIVKVYIENSDEQVEIVTLNSEDKKSSSVTITTSAIKDYLNEIDRNKNLSSHRDDRIVTRKKNCECDNTNTTGDNEKDGGRLLNDLLVHSSMQDTNSTECYSNSIEIQSKCTTCSRFGIHEMSFTPDNNSSSEKIDENTNESNVISQNNDTNIQMNDVQNYIQVINDGDTSGSSVEQQNNLLTTIECTDTPVNVVNKQLPSSAVILDDISLSINTTNEQPDSLNPSNEIQYPINDSIDTHSKVTVTQNNETDCDNRSFSIHLMNDDQNGPRNEEGSSGREEGMDIDNEIESMITSIKNVSYDVDDFLNVVSTTPIQVSQNVYNMRLSGVSSFWDEFNNSPDVYTEDLNEDEVELQEYLVIEKIAASRFNTETKVLEFLLKAQKCVAKKEPWAPIRTNITDLTIPHPKCLYIQCPKGFNSYQRRKFQQRFDQHVQSGDTGKMYSYEMPSSQTISSPIVDITTTEFASIIAEDVVVNPRKSLNDARLIEPNVDDNKNITPLKSLKKSESISNTSDLALPSADFCIADMVPGLGDQLDEFLETNTSSPNVVNDLKISENSSKIKPSNGVRKKHRNDSKHLQCSQCPYKTASSKTLENHLRRHNKEALTCGWCPKRYLTSAGLKHHQERKHQNDKLSIVGVLETSVSNSYPATEISEIKSSFHSESLINVQNPQLPVILNEARKLTTLHPHSSLFSECDNKIKMKQNSKTRLKTPKFCPKRLKKETKEKHNNAKIIDLCDDDVNASEKIAIKDNLINTNEGETNNLQKCLADTVDAIENDELPTSNWKTPLEFPQFVCKNRDKTCDICHQSFKTTFDLFNHKENVHKYPIVLLKRLET